MDKFERVEKKFWLNDSQYEEILKYLEAKNVSDLNYEIKSIYFDDDSFTLIRKSISRPDFKEKLRLRAYGQINEDSKVFIEIKRKLNGIGYKRRMKISYKDLDDLLNQKEIDTSNEQIYKEIKEFICRYKVKPKVLIKYQRKSFEFDDLRITFDENIAYSLDVNLLNKIEYEEYLKDKGKALMEIKGSKIPLDLANKLSELKIYQEPFSKIGSLFERVKVYD